MHLGFRVWPIGQVADIQSALVYMQAAVMWSFEREKVLVIVAEGFGCTYMCEAFDSYKR
jgi:hypothetical protein